MGTLKASMRIPSSGEVICRISALRFSRKPARWICKKLEKLSEELYRSYVSEDVPQVWADKYVMREMVETQTERA